MVKHSSHSGGGVRIVGGEYGMAVTAECLNDQADDNTILISHNDVSHPIGGAGS